MYWFGVMVFNMLLSCIELDFKEIYIFNLFLSFR